MGTHAEPQATRTLSDGPDQHSLGFRDFGREVTDLKQATKLRQATGLPEA